MGISIPVMQSLLKKLKEEDESNNRMHGERVPQDAFCIFKFLVFQSFFCMLNSYRHSSS